MQRIVLATRYRVVALDNRGAGRSDKPFGTYTLEQMADDAIAVLDARRHRSRPRGRCVDGWRHLADRRPEVPRAGHLAHAGVHGVPQPPVAARAAAGLGHHRQRARHGRHGRRGRPLGHRPPLVPPSAARVRLARTARDGPHRARLRRPGEGHPRSRRVGERTARDGRHPHAGDGGQPGHPHAARRQRGDRRPHAQRRTGGHQRRRARLHGRARQHLQPRAARVPRPGHQGRSGHARRHPGPRPPRPLLPN